MSLGSNGNPDGNDSIDSWNMNVNTPTHTNHLTHHNSFIPSMHDSSMPYSSSLVASSVESSSIPIPIRIPSRPQKRKRDTDTDDTNQHEHQDTSEREVAYTHNHMTDDETGNSTIPSHDAPLYDSELHRPSKHPKLMSDQSQSTRSSFTPFRSNDIHDAFAMNASSLSPELSRINLKRTGPPIHSIHEMMRPPKRIHEDPEIKNEYKLAHGSSSNHDPLQSHRSSSLHRPHRLRESAQLLSQLHEERVERKRQQIWLRAQEVYDATKEEEDGQSSSHRLTEPQHSSKGFASPSDSRSLLTRPQRMSSFVFRSSPAAAASLSQESETSDGSFGSPAINNLMLSSPPLSASKASAASGPVGSSSGGDMMVDLPSRSSSSIGVHRSLSNAKVPPSTNKLPMSPLTRFSSPRQPRASSVHASGVLDDPFSLSHTHGRRSFAHIPWWLSSENTSTSHSPARPAHGHTREGHGGPFAHLAPSPPPTTDDANHGTAGASSSLPDPSWASTFRPAPRSTSGFYSLDSDAPFETEPWNADERHGGAHQHLQQQVSQQRHAFSMAPPSVHVPLKRTPAPSSVLASKPESLVRTNSNDMRDD